MPKNPEITTEIEVKDDDAVNVKQLAIEIATMVAVTVAGVAATHFVIKKIEEKKA